MIRKWQLHGTAAEQHDYHPFPRGAQLVDQCELVLGDGEIVPVKALALKQLCEAAEEQHRVHFLCSHQCFFLQRIVWLMLHFPVALCKGIFDLRLIKSHLWAGEVGGV